MLTVRRRLALVALVATLVPAACSSSSKARPTTQPSAPAAFVPGGEPLARPYDATSAFVRGDALTVRTADGPVHGVAVRGTRRFFALPYAAPPVGRNRFRAPQPEATWTTTRAAEKAGPVCPQVLPVVNQSQGQEDCLYLDVTVPEQPPKDLAPVMVWIHGGGFTVGSAHDDDPTELVARSGVVVVSINYRLGPFGFLADRALQAEDPSHATGTMGFLDQVAALKWVRRAVAGFGGDPRNVTLFGESAGGMSVCAHLLSPRSKGLFERAIMESAPCNQAGIAEGPALAQGDELARRLGCADGRSRLGCLRSKSTRAVLGAYPGDPTFLFRKAAFWMPVGDGVVLPADAGAAIDAGRFNAVPIIAGVNRDEGRLFIGMAADSPGALVPSVSASTYAARAAKYFGPRVGAEVVRRYPLAAYPQPDAAFGQAVGDAILACPAIDGALAFAPKVPVYLYEYTHTPNPFVLPLTHIDLGAFHSAELPYVFGGPVQSSGVFTFTPAERKLSDTVIAAWTRFARTGGPGSGELVWPPAGSDRRYLVLDTPTKVAGRLKSSECGFWEHAGWDASKAGRE